LRETALKSPGQKSRSQRAAPVVVLPSVAEGLSVPWRKNADARGLFCNSERPRDPDYQIAATTDLMAPLTNAHPGMCGTRINAAATIATAV